MTELRTDLAAYLVDATVASSRGDIRHASAVADHRRGARTAYRVLALALVHGLRSARRPVEPGAVPATN